MKTEKYKKLIHQRIIQTIEDWTNQDAVAEQDIHRFFHNLKGTSGTIGLAEVEKFSEAKELLFSEKSAKALQLANWSEHVLPLADMFQPAEQRVEESEFDAGSLNQAHSFDENFRTQKRVLVIDDDVEFVTYVKEILEKHDYPVSIALTAERGLKIFYEWKPSLILLDFILPDQSGMYVLQHIVEKAKLEHIPIIMVSGNFSIENQVNAYRSGAMDFLAKPLEVELLTALIENRFAMKKDWDRSIIVDELTGAYNRKHFNRMMRQQMDDFKRSEHKFSLVMLDLDYFKHVNDNHGHLKGDEVLQAFVSTAQDVVQSKGILCRYGGEEFALILPHMDNVQAAGLIEQLRHTFNAIKFPVKDAAFQVTFSSGIAQISENTGHAEKLVDEADQALYCAKRAGRNQTVLYSAEMLERKNEMVLNLIVVDDDPLIRDILINRFFNWKPTNHAKVNALGFADGRSFLSSDWYNESAKYIILLDGSMPDLDGLEVLRRLRECYPEQQLLIIMLTARNNTEDIVHALQIGADDYVVKPFHMQELVLRIERLASRILND